MANANQKPLPLWYQLFNALFVGILLLVSCAGSIQYLVQKRNLDAELEDQYLKQFQSLLYSYSGPLMENRFNELQTLSDHFVELDHELINIDLTGVNDYSLIDWQRWDQTINSHIITYTDTIDAGDDALFVLTATWTLDRFYRQLLQQVLFQQLLLAFSLIIMAGMLMILINKRLIKPVRLLNRKIATLGENSETDFNENSDLSLEVSLLNKCIANLSKSYKKLVITEKVLYSAKQQIESLNRRNSNILNAAGEGIFVINKKGVIIFMNYAGTDMTGWDAHDINGMHFQCLMPKTHLNVEGIKNTANSIFSSSEAEKYINQTLNNAKKHHIDDAQFINKNGHLFPVEYISTPLKSETGDILGAVITFKDIYERIQSEMQLKESQSLKQAMLESSHDAIITLDEKGLICEFNKEAEHMFGYKTDKVLGKQLDRLIVPKRYLEQRKDFFSSVSENGQIASEKRKKIELSVLRKNHQEFPAEIAVAPITLNNKKYWTVFISDITERKQVKEAMEAARQNAENANVAKSQFLATMSHEIRTPLSALVGVQDLLLTTELNEEQNNYINIAQQSAQTLQDVINDILDFSKIEAGKLILEFRETDPMDLIDSVLSVMASKALEKNIELVYSVSYPIPKTVLLDPVRIKQVLYNLIGNAIKFTHDGYINVHVSLAQFDHEDAILFEVIDTGIGISEEALSSLFEEFTQADLSTTRKYGGTGLGLAISSRLIKMSNGVIKVQSEVGKGSNFSFHIKPIKPPYFSPEPIENLYCWVLNSGCKSTQVLYEHLQSLVVRVNLIDTLNQIRAYDDPAILFIDSEKLDSLSESRLKNVISRNSITETIALVDIDQPKLAKQWKQVINKQLPKPVLHKKLMLCLQPYTHDPEAFYRSLGDATPELEKPELDLNDRVILLAEDSVLIQQVTINMLQKINCRVELAENGLIAYEKSLVQGFDLILMDLSMPEMGGMEATEKIRSTPGPNQNTAIVALTANAFKDDYKRCKVIGMDGFLTKPLTFESLQSEINRVLKEELMQDDKMEAELQVPDNVEVIDSVEFEALEPVNNAELINLDIISRLQDEMSEQLFPQMMDLFIEQGEVRIKAIETAVDTQDFGMLSSEVHTLKSESTTFGATELGALSTEANRLCKEGLQEQAFELAGHLKPSWQKTIAELQKILVT